MLSLHHFLSVTPIGATALLLSLTACSNNDGERVQETEKEVLAIHDEVMPRLDSVMVLRKQITQRIDSLDKAGGSTQAASATLRTDDEKSQLMLLSQRLREADSLMMDWMSRYNGDTLKQLDQAQAVQYLEQEKEKITNVKDKINSSIADARRYLDE
ncbi:hypothetical protein GCM10023189_23320 [Nibrella saemangeumensis]|uniref:Viral A-type inclusion protein n=1 Tax=Nibrella saemangeumensis TaxID=1084526 RepID=A0ABP8MVD2_9BACT